MLSREIRRTLMDRMIDPRGVQVQEEEEYGEGDQSRRMFVSNNFYGKDQSSFLNKKQSN